MSADNSTSSGNGPGKTLYQARTALGLNPENVAQMLHLSPRQIIALESDDYVNLPEPTYVRGYLRSYSQLLGLPPDSILEAYARLQESHVKVDLGKLAPTPQISSNDRLIQISTLIVAGLVIGMVVIWWQGEDQGWVPSQLPVAQSVDGALVDAEDVGLSLPIDGLLGPELAPDAPLGEESVSSQTADNSFDIGLGVGTEESMKPLPETTAAPVKPEQIATVPESSPPAVSVPLQEDIKPASDVKRARLVLYAEEDSWADIRDATQRKMIYRTIAAGRVLTLEGVPPFSIFLGNVDGVRLELNGKPYDASQHRRGLVARFTLDVEPESSE